MPARHTARFNSYAGTTHRALSRSKEPAQGCRRRGGSPAALRCGGTPCGEPFFPLQPSTVTPVSGPRHPFQQLGTLRQFKPREAGGTQHPVTPRIATIAGAASPWIAKPALSRRAVLGGRRDP